MFDWNIVVEIGIFAVVAVIAAAVLPWVKAKIGAETYNQLWKWVCTAVQAAEQLFGAGKGTEKKAYAVKLLNDMGIKISEKEDAMIEAAVRELT